jgi:hypothetical protein
MFISNDVMDYVVFDPVNSYPLERVGDKQDYLVEY